MSIVENNSFLLGATVGQASESLSVDVAAVPRSATESILVSETIVHPFTVAGHAIIPFVSNETVKLVFALFLL